MKTYVSSRLQGAKGPVHPTTAQERWLDDARALLALAAELARAGHRIRHARHEAPEVVVLDHLIHVIERGIELARRARAEGRQIEWAYPPGVEPLDGVPALRLAPPVAPVADLAAYRARKGGHRG